MSIADLREELLRDRARAEAGDAVDVVALINRVLAETHPERLLTTTEAANLLGLRSVNSIKSWCRKGTLRCVQVGSRTMVPQSEVERARDSEPVRAMRWSDQMHDLSADFGVEEGLSDDEMQILSASRPGRLPWQK